MSGGQRDERILVAPERLDLDHRETFRRAAEALLDALPVGTGRLVIDLAATADADSTGLGVLIMVRRRAQVRRQAVRLRAVGERLRSLLELTKMDSLFEWEAEEDR